jgi:hypothetical protein
VRDVPVVFVTAGRLLLRHWPALLTLALLGAAVRNGALWAAVRLSDVHGQLGQLMLVVAPLGYLLPIVAMLSICRRSLPALLAADARVEVAPTEGRQLRLVDVAVSVLLPFLAVYESYGLLGADIERFRNLAAADEFNQFSLGPITSDYQGRLGIYSLQVALAIVAAAWLARWVLGRVEQAVGLYALAFVGAFVEVYYTAQLAGQSVVIRQRGEVWVRERVAVGWLESAYDAVVDALGPVAGAFRWLADGVQAVAGSLDAVVLVPVAWLTLGAVVLGYRLADQEPVPAAEEPARGRGLLRSFAADVRERFSALTNGLRLLASAGLAPMLAFSLLFLVVVRTPALLAHVVRGLVGPQPWDTTYAFDPALTAIGFALSMALTAPLLAAAVDWLIRARAARRSPAAPTTPAPA